MSRSFPICKLNQYGTPIPINDNDVTELTDTFALSTATVYSISGTQKSQFLLKTTINGEEYSLLLQYVEPLFSRPTEAYYHTTSIVNFKNSSWTTKTASLNSLHEARGFSFSFFGKGLFQAVKAQRYTYTNDTMSNDTAPATSRQRNRGLSCNLNGALIRAGGKPYDYDFNEAPSKGDTDEYVVATDSYTTLTYASISFYSETAVYCDNAPFSVANGKMYSMYGLDGYANAVTHVTEYNRATDSWSLLDVSSPTPPRAKVQSATIDKTQIIIAGGRDDSDGSTKYATTTKFIPTSSVFIGVTDMAEKKYEGASFIIGGAFYVAGGYDTNDDQTTSSAKYTMPTDTWVGETPLPANGSGCATLTVI